MQKIFTLLLLTTICIGVLFSCAKYKDPKGYDPHLPNHYCNDPKGVNYNWNFPGVADNTVCFYPTDVFAGKYLFVDSIHLQTGFYFLKADSIYLTIKKINDTQMAVYGFCPGGDSLRMTATPVFTASVDTTEGDSATNRGQMFCSAKDTINGTFTQNRLDSVLTISLLVASDTGVVTLHLGIATPIK